MSDSHEPLFDAKQHALEDAYQKCPDCGQSLSVKHGKAGAFIGCTAYPACSYTRPLHPETEEFDSKLIPDSECPACQHQLAVKNGRYGMFIGCSNFPECHHIESQQDEERESEVQCPSCKKGHLTKRTSRYGKVFYSCNQYPSCNYILNFEPVSHTCPECNWSVMTQKKIRGTLMRVCPQKKCGHKEPVSSL